MSLWPSVRDVTHWGQIISEVLAKVWSTDLSRDHLPRPWVYNWNRYTWWLKSPPYWVLGLWDFPLSSSPPPLPAKKVNKTQYCILGEMVEISKAIKDLECRDGGPHPSCISLAVWFLQKLAGSWSLTGDNCSLSWVLALTSTVLSHTILRHSNTG